MNKKVLIAIPLCLIGIHQTSQVTAQDDCVEMSVPPACTGRGSITINTNSKNISPPHLCASPGESISVNIVPSGSVEIEGKDSGWPNGSGSSFTITAPGVGSYDYNVHFEDGSCVDPKISVD
jgi:hypothetical protein